MALDPIIGGGLISGAGNLLSTIIGNKARKKESELAYQRSIKDRDNQREYESPEQQMKRLKEGGLNPHLIYGQGTDASGGSGQQPEYNPASVNDPKVSGIPDAIYKSKQIENVQTNLGRQQAQFDQQVKNDAFRNALTQAQTDLTKLNAVTADFTNTRNTATYQAQVDKIWTESAIANQALENDKLKGEQQASDLRVSKATEGERIKAFKITNEKTEAGIKQLTAQTQLTNNQAQKVVQEINTILKDLPIKDQELLNRKAQGKKITSEAELTKLKKIEQNIINRTSEWTGGKSGNIASGIINVAGNMLGALSQRTR